MLTIDRYAKIISVGKPGGWAMLKLIGDVPRQNEAHDDSRLHRAWTHLYLGVAVTFAVFLTQLFGPWLVLALWESWTGLSLSLVP